MRDSIPRPHVERLPNSPAGDFEVQPGDRLVMMGAADRFAECADLFRGSSAWLRQPHA